MGVGRSSSSAGTWDACKSMDHQCKVTFHGHRGVNGGRHRAHFGIISCALSINFIDEPMPAN
jgi:hypothetical protein